MRRGAPGLIAYTSWPQEHKVAWGLRRRASSTCPPLRPRTMSSNLYRQATLARTLVTCRLMVHRHCRQPSRCHSF